MTDLLAILVNAVVLGSIYGLVAIGMTLIYGVLRVMDMSQGSMVMAGGFVAAGLMGELGLPGAVTIVAAFAITFVLGVLTQLISVQPLLNRKSIDFEMVTFITTFAVALIFANIALETFGPQQRSVPPVVEGSIEIYNGVTIPYQSLVMAAVAITIMVGLGLYLRRSRYGMAIRAVAEDNGAARMMGVPVRRMFPLVMGVASGFAGIAGVFLAAQFFASPTSGDLPLLQALIVVILGGLGSMRGTIYAAYTIGLIQATVAVTISTTWSMPVLYAVIVLVLIFRPQGLAGKASEARL